ncbi:MAG: tetratricopeptide repeat protein [Sedimenticolaceae bacterium]
MPRLIIVLGCLLAIALGPTSTALAQDEAAIAAGQEKAAAGDFKGALQEYLELTRTHPDSFEAHALLGGMQLLDQHYPDAVKSFQRAVSLGDTSARPFLGMGMAYLHMGQLGPARAAFVEAKSRGVADTDGVDQVISYIDRSDPDATGIQH